jgi:anti-sigma factor RsiW
MTCKDLIEILTEYLEGALTPDVLARFEEHLAVCAPCVAYLKTFRRSRELTGRVAAVGMPPEMKRRLRDLLLEQLGQAGRSRGPRRARAGQTPAPR